MDRIDCCLTFTRVYELRSFSAVAREQQTTQPTVSKRIATLEAWFGVQLFTRTTRRLQPTAEADAIYGHVRTMIDALESAQHFGRHAAEASGTLRVTVPTSFGRAQILLRIPRYLDRHPQVRFDFHFTEQIVDLVADGIELGIRIGDLPTSSVVARRLGTTRRITVASAAYLARRGEPRTPEDLARHDCIVYSRFGNANRWTFDSESGLRTVEVAGPLRVDDADAMRDGVLSDLGIALLPTWLLGEEMEAGGVRRVLEDFEAPSLPINVVYPDMRWLSVRARTFIDFLVAELK